MSYIAPAVQAKFETLSIELKNQILERNVQINNIYDLIRQALVQCKGNRMAAAKLLGITVCSLAGANMGVYAVISPLTPIVVKCGDGRGLGGVAGGAGVGGCAGFGAGRSLCLGACIPVVRLCFFRGTAF